MLSGAAAGSCSAESARLWSGVATFRDTTVRPMALRALLREAREHGEALVAWGTMETVPDAAVSTLKVALGAIPIVGLAAGGVVFRPRRLVAVVTDQRAMLISGDVRRRGRPDRLLPDAWLSTLVVRRVSRGCFAAKWPEWDREVRVRVVGAGGRGPRRLRAALEELAAG